MRKTQKFKPSNQPNNTVCKNLIKMDNYLSKLYAEGIRLLNLLHSKWIWA